MSDAGSVGQAGASAQAALASLNIANDQQQVAAQLVEAAAQQAGPAEDGKGNHVDEQA